MLSLLKLKESLTAWLILYTYNKHLPQQFLCLVVTIKHFIVAILLWLLWLLLYHLKLIAAIRRYIHTHTGLYLNAVRILRSPGCRTWSDLLNSQKCCLSLSGPRLIDMQSSSAKQNDLHESSDFTHIPLITWLTRVRLSNGCSNFITLPSSTAEVYFCTEKAKLLDISLAGP